MPGNERVRAAELVATLCLATDLGMGFPLEHGLNATLMSMRLGELLEVDQETAHQTYYASLLMFAGCTAGAESAEIFGGDLTEHYVPVMFASRLTKLGGVLRALPPPGDTGLRRVLETARRLPRAAADNKTHMATLCEVTETLARRLGLPPAVYGLFTDLTERWDGASELRRARGDTVPLPLRIIHIARDAALHRMLDGDEAATRVVGERAGHAFDPEIAAKFVDGADEVLDAATGDEGAWDAVLSTEPRPHVTLEGETIDRAFAAIADFTDLVSPTLAGHSAGVAALAARAAERRGFDGDEIRRIRRAGLVHDVGRVAVSPKVWGKEGPLSPDETEQVRLHAYHTERVLARSPVLGEVAAIACAHHERLDGGGYHRRVPAAMLSPPERLLAAADAFHAMTEPRPHRPPRSPETAAEILGREADAGRFDPPSVSAVIEAAGQRVPPLSRPAGLTDRETEVLGLVARGLQTKQTARSLDISAKTADRHIQNAYRKIGVSTRAAATLFVMEHGLVPWGELPIPGSEGGL